MPNKLCGMEVNVHGESETFCQQHHFVSVPKWIPMDELLRILLRFIYDAAVIVAAAHRHHRYYHHPSIKEIARRKKKYTIALANIPSERVSELEKERE